MTPATAGASGSSSAERAVARYPARGVEPRAMSDSPSWIGTKLGDRDGMRVGVVCDVFFDDANQRPAWLLVNLLRIGERYALVPANGARSWRGMVTIPFECEHVRSSPRVEPSPVLRGELLVRLARHYGVRVDRSAGYAAVHGTARMAHAA